jgi:ribosomal silencing factor RsfS
MTPTAKYALATDHSIRFTEDQVVAKGDGTYHIKGVASAVVVKLPQTFTNVVKDSEGNTIDSYTAIDFGVSPANLTGDPNIDNK